ncbi:unnamed protein product [Durusdinium trenchii]|uniref:Secreted protein n=1 Tax=Durusdinium trenchii TaxID=1381693 RepID=A0ABP0T216_9DINO
MFPAFLLQAWSLSLVSMKACRPLMLQWVSENVVLSEFEGFNLMPRIVAAKLEESSPHQLYSCGCAWGTEDSARVACLSCIFSYGGVTLAFASSPNGLTLLRAKGFLFK